MKKRNAYVCLAPMSRLSRLSLLAAALVPAALFASGGYASYKIACGARQVAMGETGVASAAGADAMRWNPALLLQGPKIDVSLNHALWFAGTSQSAVFIKRGIGKLAIGAEVLYFTSGEVELRDSIASAEPLGTYTFADLSLGLGAAVEIVKETRAGVLVRFYNERLWQYSGSTWGLDAGLDYNPLPGLDFGFSVMDLGFDTRLIADAFRPPMTLRMGASYAHDWNANIATAVNLDFLYRVYDKEPGLRTGVEVKLFDLLSLRAGAKFLYASSEDSIQLLSPTELLTFGLGVSRKGVGVNYALAPYNRLDLGLTHRISVNLAFD